MRYRLKRLSRIELPVLAVLVVAALLFGPGWIRFGHYPWELPDQNGVVLAGLSAVLVLLYLGVAAVGRSRRAPTDAWFVLTGGAAGLAALFFAYLMLPVDQYSRALFLVATAMTGGAMLLPVIGRYSSLLARTTSLLVLLAPLSLHLAPAEDDPNAPRPNRETAVLRASHHSILATYYRNALPPRDGPTTQGGAIAALPGGGYLLVRSTGELYFAQFREGALGLTPLGLRAPINLASFVSDTGGDFSTSFRIADVALDALPDGRLRLFVSHHYWDHRDSCATVRVSSTMLERPLNPVADGDWQTVFETSPCLTLQHGARGTAFGGEQIGGNMQLLDTDTLLLTVGDHQFDGWYHEPDLIQDDTTDYGKTLMIDLRSGVTTTFTRGHRNPQGLTVDQDGVIWSTEHGPQGGDELNVLVRGGNYGYPLATYGTEYGGVEWPLANASALKQHTPPTFAWVPSIGISDLVPIREADWPRWEKSLLIASLRAQSLWRTRIEAGRVVFTEPIDVRLRIRDLAGGVGEIVAWADDETIVRLQPASQLDDGSVVYAQRCSGCHDDRIDGIGPALTEIVGRPVASRNDYDYSPALMSIEGTWTLERLDRFLADPQRFAPGTRMPAQMLTNPGERELLLEYLDSKIYNYLTR